MNGNLVISVHEILRIGAVFWLMGCHTKRDLDRVHMIISKILSTLKQSYYILELKERQYQKPRDLEKIQGKRLRRIITHAYNHVPFYHSLFKKRGIKPSNINTVADLRKLPIISKADVLQNWESFISNTARPEKCTIACTSGSTGTPMKILVDNVTRDINLALVYYAFFECGMHITDRFLELTAAFPSTSKRVFWYGPGYWMKGNYLSVFNDPALNVKEILRINPDTIYSFPSALECIMEDFGDELRKIKPHLLCIQGEMLTEKRRKLIEECWGLNPNNTYGSREFLRIAFECNEHQGLHVLTDWLVFELVKDGEDVGSNEQARTVVTSLYNYTMPLIRYDLGDLAIWSDDKCACGRSWPLLKEISGRFMDFVTLPSGKKVPFGLILVFLRAIEGIKRFQVIVQESKKNVIAKIICNRNAREKDRELIRQKVMSKVKLALLYEGFNIQVKFENTILQQPSGKIPFFILEK